MSCLNALPYFACAKFVHLVSEIYLFGYVIDMLFPLHIFKTWDITLTTPSSKFQFECYRAIYRNIMYTIHTYSPIQTLVCFDAPRIIYVMTGLTAICARALYSNIFWHMNGALSGVKSNISGPLLSYVKTELTVLFPSLLHDILWRETCGSTPYDISGIRCLRSPIIWRLNIVGIYSHWHDGSRLKLSRGLHGPCYLGPLLMTWIIFSPSMDK